MTLLLKTAGPPGGRAAAAWPGRSVLPGCDVWRDNRERGLARWDIGPQGRSGVWLPAAPGRAAVDHAGRRPPPDALRGMRVLLVDDSPETLEAFRLLLEIEGAHVQVANGGAAALTLTEREGFDLILSDIGMPGMDGYELIAQLRARPSTQATPAFALSGFGDRAGIERALRAGFQAYIDKPVTLDDLLHALVGTAVPLGRQRET